MSPLSLCLNSSICYSTAQGELFKFSFIKSSVVGVIV